MTKAFAMPSYVSLPPALRSSSFAGLPLGLSPNTVRSLHAEAADVGQAFAEVRDSEHGVVAR